VDRTTRVTMSPARGFVTGGRLGQHAKTHLFPPGLVTIARRKGRLGRARGGRRICPDLNLEHAAAEFGAVRL